MIDYLQYLKDNTKIDLELINNKYFDFTKNKLKIDIIIPIYFYNQKNTRYYFQETIFKHWKNIQKIFSNYIDFSFTIVGSEEKFSKKISLKYFENNEYYEFYQNPKLAILKMLSQKFNYGFKQAYKKNVDIILLAGSNDYICFHFFYNILINYNNSYQQYGISNFYEGNNLCLYVQYDNLYFNLKKIYIHDGVHNYSRRQKYKYIGGLHGYSKKLLDKFPNILDKTNCDEGNNEYIITLLIEQYPDLNINSMKTKNCFFINTKFGNDSEINSFKNLLKLIKKSKILKINTDINNDNNYINLFGELIYLQKISVNKYYISDIKNKLNLNINNLINYLMNYQHDNQDYNLDNLIYNYIIKTKKINKINSKTISLSELTNSYNKLFELKKKEYIKYKNKISIIKLNYHRNLYFQIIEKYIKEYNNLYDNGLNVFEQNIHLLKSNNILKNYDILTFL